MRVPLEAERRKVLEGERRRDNRQLLNGNDAILGRSPFHPLNPDLGGCAQQEVQSAKGERGGKGGDGVLCQSAMIVGHSKRSRVLLHPSYRDGEETPPLYSFSWKGKSEKAKKLRR